MPLAKLDQLEAAGDWNAAMSFAKARMDDPRALVRIVFYGWYLPLEGDFLPRCTGKMREAAGRQLGEVLPAAKASSSAEVLREVGYGMSQVAFMLPWDPAAIEREYRELLGRAWVLGGNDPVCGALLRRAGAGEDVRFDRSDWAALVAGRFAGIGEYNRYYRDLLADPPA